MQHVWERVVPPFYWQKQMVELGLLFSLQNSGTGTFSSLDLKNQITNILCLLFCFVFLFPSSPDKTGLIINLKFLQYCPWHLLVYGLHLDLSIDLGRVVWKTRIWLWEGFMLFQRALIQSEIQITWYRNWTWFYKFIFYDNNHCASLVQWHINS